ncbi:MAG: RidA family protein [Candidatus Nanoarchaeia archaeon]
MVKEIILDFESAAGGLIERYNIEGLAPAVGAYTHVTAIRRGTNYTSHAYELRISGMLPINEHVEVIGDDCFTQTKKIIDNIALAIISAATRYGLDFSKEQALNHILDTTVFLNYMTDFKQVNDAYIEEKMPLCCRAAFAVKELPLTHKGVKVEIRANALIPIKTLA